MNLFKLAELQLHKERKEITWELILIYAIKIRKHLDKNRFKDLKSLLNFGKIRESYDIINYPRITSRYINQPHTNKSYLLED
jgi:hypothetical protein